MTLVVALTPSGLQMIHRRCSVTMSVVLRGSTPATAGSEILRQLHQTDFFLLKKCLFIVPSKKPYQKKWNKEFVLRNASSLFLCDHNGVTPRCLRCVLLLCHRSATVLWKTLAGSQGSCYQGCLCVLLDSAKGGQEAQAFIKPQHHHLPGVLGVPSARALALPLADSFA